VLRIRIREALPLRNFENLSDAIVPLRRPRAAARIRTLREVRTRAADRMSYDAWKARNCADDELGDKAQSWMTAIVTKEIPKDDWDLPASYTIRIFEGIYKLPQENETDEELIRYDSNTINLRAATEFIALVTRNHAVEAEDVYFGCNCYDLERSWRSYNELR
jgi:hypothetical protein